MASPYLVLSHVRLRHDAHATPRSACAVAFITLFPFALASEFNIFMESVAYRPLATFGFLLGSCMVAVVYNVVLFQSVHTLSSVGTAILGNVKIVRSPSCVLAV